MRPASFKIGELVPMDADCADEWDEVDEADKRADAEYRAQLDAGY
jgi:hypothetical protein